MTVSSKIYAGTPSPAGPVWLAFDCVRAEASVRRKLQRLAAGDVVFIGRFAARFGIRDYASFHEFLQVLVQRLHAELLTGLDRRVHLRDLGFADQIVDGRRAYHDLVRGDPAGTVLGLEQRLRNDRAQRGGDHRADHVLLGSRKHVDDAVDGLRRRTGVQRAEYQVAGFGAGQRQSDGFQVAHLPYQDHVRVFTQRAAQRVVERQGVRPDFTLVDQALLRFVHELDRVLDGEDVSLFGLVLVVDHRRQRGGFARSGRSGHQHLAARLVGDLFKDLRAFEIGERQDLGRDGPHHGCGAAVLHERVDAKARQAWDGEGEVALQVLLVELALAVIHDVIDHAVDVFVVHSRQVYPLDVAVHADHRRQSGRQMQVRSLVFDHEGQQFRDIHL